MNGIQATFALLSETENETASELLVKTLSSRDRSMRENALTAILNRRVCSGHKVLIENWHNWSDRWRTKIAERSARVANAMRNALISEDPQLQKNGCDSVLWCREYDLSPTLLAAAIERDDEVGRRAGATLLQLCELLYEDLHGPKTIRRRRDPSLVKRHVSRELSSAMHNPQAAHNPEVVESFLLLTSKDNTSLRQSLDSRSAARYKEITHILKTSQRPGVMRLVCELLQVQRIPVGATDVISERCDVPFVRRLLKSFDEHPTESINRNVARVKTLAWLDPQRSVLAALNDEEQAIAVDFVCKSGVDEERTMQYLREVMENGKVGGRAAVAKAVRDVNGFEGNTLLLKAIDDESPIVQKTVLPIFRERSIPGAVTRLGKLIDSPDRELREEVRLCLAEFTFQRFLDTFDSLDEETRWRTGELVVKIDDTVHERLVEELDSTSRMRRVKALQIAPMVGLVDAVVNQVFELMHADDDFTRAEAATALGFASAPSAQATLQAAANDSNSLVSQAARDALARLAGPEPAPAAEMTKPETETEDTPTEAV